jgi:hypothetical protein
VSSAAITLCVASQRVSVVVVDFVRLSPETFGYTLVFIVSEINLNRYRRESIISETK